MRQRKDVDCLLFDLGGVILEINFDRCFSYWAEVSARSVEEIKQAFTFDAAYERHERGEISAEEYCEILKRSLNIDISFTDFAVGWNAIFVGEFESADAVLNQAKTILPLYALTNSNALHKSHWENRFSNTLGNFTEIFNSSDMGFRKPEARAFEHISKMIDVPLNRILFFDDLIENVEAAQKLGMKTVLVSHFDDVANALKSVST